MQPPNNKAKGFAQRYSRVKIRVWDHLSRMHVTMHLKHPTLRRSRVTPHKPLYLDLLRMGLAMPMLSPALRWALTLPAFSCINAPTFSPLPAFAKGARSAVYFLWRLSLGSPPLAVSQHPFLSKTLWSPDFPLLKKSALLRSIKQRYPRFKLSSLSHDTQTLFLVCSRFFPTPASLLQRAVYIQPPKRPSGFAAPMIRALPASMLGFQLS